MKYSERLLKTASLLQNGELLADIGCDHGYICILGLETGKFKRALACDVAEGPISRARENAALAGYSDRITAILSDGFKNIEEQPDCAVICGMGGSLIRKILSEGGNKTCNLKQLVLGPHSEIAELRNFIIYETGFSILRETTLKDSGKYYVLMDLRPASDATSPVDRLYKNRSALEFGCPENQTDMFSYIDYLRYELEKTKKAYSKVSVSAGSRAMEKASFLSSQSIEIEKLIKKSQDALRKQAKTSAGTEETERRVRI